MPATFDISTPSRRKVVKKIIRMCTCHRRECYTFIPSYSITSGYTTTDSPARARKL